MGIWDSVKQGTKNMARLNTLQQKIKNNQQLDSSERKEFEELATRTIAEDIMKSPSKYFKQSAKYGQVSIDESKQLFQVAFKTYHFNELNTYELLENGSSITSGGLGIGRAVVGGVLFGGVGAILGGVTKKRKQTNFVESLKILVTFKNRKPVSTTIDFIKKTQEKDKKYEKILGNAQETLAGFDYIINSLEENRHTELVGTIDSSFPLGSSVTDELRRYKELADEGVITIEEFEAKKKELLN
ncbi:SHOCT domain-containing protein [Enterococcus sp. BWM-S5]|uniref:SHOCT domain-containing protein n=1 Tax=Enterococcus larvae TaxID=2794352 RepID=A0ABS4CIL8_9ENTE|nr:SHOCT domain-containing protein [Enterococcus larvae]MBP1046442.1 SHOCT domain-containing protein [Enterococcus larvae]